MLRLFAHVLACPQKAEGERYRYACQDPAWVRRGAGGRGHSHLLQRQLRGHPHVSGGILRRNARPERQDRTAVLPPRRGAGPGGEQVSIYAVSTSSNRNFALTKVNLLKVFYGAEAEEEAHLWARAGAKSSERNVFVFRVDLHPEGSYEIVKEVRYVTPK